MNYKFTSTKEFKEVGPVAYRQWRAQSHCSLIHGYAMSFKLYFGSNELDARNWVMDFGGLRPIRDFITDMFDHTLLVATDDPHYADIHKLHALGIAKVRDVSATGCEAIADMLYKYINDIFLPNCGSEEAARIWCYKVEVRETGANAGFREGHRADQEDLCTDVRGMPL